jgi:rhamnulokinase
MGASLLAFDLGAESGRGILGSFDGERLELTELRRFPNGPVRLFQSLYWDPLRLFSELLETLRCYADGYGGQLDAIGIDAWGVDFALLGPGDILLENPRHYRDSRTEGMLERAFEIVPREEIFQRTGIQFMRLNTLYQLLAMREAESPLLDLAQHLLLVPDLFNFFLTGVKRSEFTNATTTQLFDPRLGSWSQELMERLGLPAHILPDIAGPGTVVGELLPDIATEVGLAGMPVIAPATHDTGSAVVAVPAEDDNFAYISSGTWSLMGVELAQPLISDQALAYNFTNEGGVGPSYRFLKNIMGLWLVQECRRAWRRQGRDFSYAQLSRLAEEATPFFALVDPDDETFLAPGDMAASLRAYCSRTGQEIPGSEGEVVRVALESLALKYRWVLERLEEILGRRLSVIHIVGGGIQNELLCQFTADAADRPVIAGPAEATAIGNCMVQAMGLGEVDSLAQIRSVVRLSFEPKLYRPRSDRGGWDEAYGQLQDLLNTP